MPGYFYCRHCGKCTRKNPRIKSHQGHIVAASIGNRPVRTCGSGRR